MSIDIGDLVTFSLPTLPVGELTGVVEDVSNYPMVRVKVTQGNIIGCTFIISADKCVVH